MKSTAICLTIAAVGVGLGYMIDKSTTQSSQAASNANLNARRQQLSMSVLYQPLTRPTLPPPAPVPDPWQQYYNEANILQQQRTQLLELERQTKVKADARNR